MSTTTTCHPAIGQFAIPPEPVLPLSVGQYHAMIRADILESGAPIELLEGWLVIKMTKSPRHCAATSMIRRRLGSAVSDNWSVDSQDPVTTADSELEPDVAVIRGLREQYLDRHPGPEEIALVVEVADSSLERDRNWRKRIYAAAGVPVYWIVNLIDGQIDVFTQPSGASGQPDYAKTETFSAGTDVPVDFGFDELGRIAVDDLLP